jgi:hypothetical protein
MKRTLCIGIVAVAALGGTAFGQTGDAAQEDLALALAKSHAKTHLIVSSMVPFHIEATVLSGLALRATGKGRVDEQWVDATHWQRQIQFEDYQQIEMRNDDGQPWISASPLLDLERVNDLERELDIAQPSSSQISGFQVKEETIKAEQQTQTCFTAEPAKQKSTDFPLHYVWCFDTESGLPLSEDVPLQTHVIFKDYVTFHGKQVPTHIVATIDGLPEMEIKAKYSDLDPHALDALAPTRTMNRKPTGGVHRVNPEDLKKGWEIYAPNPLLPVGTPQEDADKPVNALFLIDETGHPIDIAVGSAPNQAMAEAALDIGRHWVFQPLLVDGKGVKSRTPVRIDFINLPPTK